MADRLNFGPFAGYDFLGPTETVRAAWTVPSVLPTSTPGSAATWIGAQAPGHLGGNIPFIQVGTTEASVAGKDGDEDVYYAFWSDTDHRYGQVRLFPVSAGDQMTARLVHDHRLWTVFVRDQTSETYAKFTTSDEARASFDGAEWNQEDPRDNRARRPYPYPQLSSVQFRQVSVDGHTPERHHLAPVWMSVGGVDLKPTTITKESFKLTVASPMAVATATRLSEVAGTVDRLVGRYVAVLRGASASTPTDQLSAYREWFVRSMGAVIAVLREPDWEASARPVVDRLARSYRTEVSEAESLATGAQAVNPNARSRETAGLLGIENSTENAQVGLAAAAPSEPG